MKTSNSLIGGTLKPGYEKEVARYLRNFIEAYQAEGIPIYALTLQNEPNFVPDEYPGMFLSPQQQLDLAIAVYEEFHLNLNGKKELETKIWINDHNFEDWVHADYILTNLDQMGKKHYVDATAFHNYSNSPASHMQDLHQKHPNTNIVFTEHSEWGVSGMYTIQQYFWNWSQSYMYWVTMTTAQLDEHNQGPYNNLEMLSPTLLIEASENPANWYKTPEYYLIGQFSKFIKPGAYRIKCDRGSAEHVTFVAFKNSDGSLILVAVNQTEEEQSFIVKCKGNYFQAILPYKSVGTYIWYEN
jgi:O-glycosyl hydrolase